MLRIQALGASGASWGEVRVWGMFRGLASRGRGVTAGPKRLCLAFLELL